MTRWATGGHLQTDLRTSWRASRSTKGFDSLMALRPDPLEAVHHGGLGHAKRQPSLDLELERDVELSHQLFLLLRDIFFAVELDLKGELSHQRQVLATGAPQGDVAFGQHALAEVQLTEREEHLLDDASIDRPGSVNVPGPWQLTSVRESAC